MTHSMSFKDSVIPDYYDFLDSLRPGDYVMVRHLGNPVYVGQFMNINLQRALLWMHDAFSNAQVTVDLMADGIVVYRTASA